MSCAMVRSQARPRRPPARSILPRRWTRAATILPAVPATPPVGVLSWRRVFPMRKRFIACSILVAVVGLSSALVIYLRAGDDSALDENVQIVIVDGKSYRIPLADTKTYRRDLQRFGGQAAVLADDFNRWFAGLWHGRSLGITTAWISATVSAGLFAL